MDAYLELVSNTLKIVAASLFLLMAILIIGIAIYGTVLLVSMLIRRR